jgi:pyruvate dehydrogenase E1 component subunit alpha
VSDALKHAPGTHTPPIVPGTPEHRRELLHQMLLVRRFEERCIELYQSTKIRGFLHLYIGEEAVAVGVMQSLEPRDAVLATYREHGHALARGVDPGAVMAEMFGKVTGCSRGRGGSMHLFDIEHGLYGGNAIVAGHLPLAVGVGLGAQMLKTGAVAACFFGEGAVAEGEFHESMNLASLWKLPVVFLCENNSYAMGTAVERSEGQTDLTLKAVGYGMPAYRLDGMDVEAVEHGVRSAVAIAREGGPVFVELTTYRFRAHSMYDPELYRDREEVAVWKQHDPIELLVGRLREIGELDDEQLATMEKEIAAVIDAAVEAGEAGELESIDELTRFVHAPGTRGAEVQS